MMIMGNYPKEKRCSMKQPLYCSTGTMVGRANTWNHRLFTDASREIKADGYELMMVTAYYEKLGEVLRYSEKSVLPFPVIHAEKDIGFYLGGDDEDREEALRLFSINCQMGRAIGAEKLVLHLWSGRRSDEDLSKNMSVLDLLYETCDKAGLLLLVENVPCAFYDPITNLTRVLTARPDAKFVYDVRFGAFHEQNDQIIASGALENGRINHLHVSDYIGPPHDFSSLRPILHLGEGIIGMESLLSKIACRYFGSVTLESPEILVDGVDAAAINRDLDYIRRVFDTVHGKE